MLLIITIEEMILRKKMLKQMMWTFKILMWMMMLDCLILRNAFKKLLAVNIDVK